MPVLELSGQPELSWQVFGDALLIEAREGDVDGWRSETFVVAACGGSARSLEPPAAAPGLAASFAVVGQWLVRCGESSQIEVFTVGDEVASQVLFPAAAGCQLHELGEGLAAIDPLAGTLVLHADPSDPGDPPRVLSRDVALAGVRCERGRLVDCWAAANAPRTIGFGDHVLVPHPHPQSRFLVTATMVDVDTGDERPFTDNLHSIQPLEDGAHTLMVGSFFASSGIGDAAELAAYDRRTRRLDHLADQIAARTAGLWVDPHIATALPRALDLVHLGSGAEYHVGPAASWQLLPSTEDTILLRLDEEATRTVRHFAIDVAHDERRLLVELHDPERDWAWPDRRHEVLFVAEDRSVRTWEGGPPVIAERVSVQDLVPPPGAVVLDLEDLGNSPPIVLFDREANLAWELEIDGDHAIVERREDRAVVLYTTRSNGQTTVWRVDL
jgi:hypothetical protein